MPKKLYKILIILGIAAIITAVFGFWLTYSAPDKLVVNYLDIGQGDAILIETPDGQNILIDGGPDNAIIRRLSEELPWYDRTIDLMILSHPHDDHVNGLNDVLRRYKVKKILYTGVVHSSPGYLNWLELIRDTKTPLVIIDRPQVIKLGDDCELRILYPLKSILGEEVDNLNNSSIIAKLVYGKTSFLFMGDAEVEVEEELLKMYIDEINDGEIKQVGSTAPLRYDYGASNFLRANVLKVGHHGSDTSSGVGFLEAVKPDIAVIQVGKDNTFGHPSRRILKRLERIGAEVYRNDINGTIRIISDGVAFELIHQ